MRRLMPLAVLAAVLTGCDSLPSVSNIGQGGPTFDPMRFFTGHVRSWGVMEDRGGQPTGIVTTDCQGVAEGADGLRMTQKLLVSGEATTREWRMRRTGPGQYEATANDMEGTAVGEASGRAFHWRWTLLLTGKAVGSVDMDQWWYLQEDGSMLNRTTIRKVGVIVAEVSEHFVPGR